MLTLNSITLRYAKCESSVKLPYLQLLFFSTEDVCVGGWNGLKFKKLAPLKNSSKFRITYKKNNIITLFYCLSISY